MKQSQNIHITTRGFTLFELLLVVILIGIITTLALPSMRSVTHRHQDLSVASHLTQLLNKVKDQATRRNRAYEVKFQTMNRDQPQGEVLILEGGTNTCQGLLEQPDLINQVAVYPFGQTEGNEENALKEKRVGVAGWRKGINGEYSVEPLTLCFSSNGALFQREGALFSEMTGVMNVAIQPFMGNGPWTPFGPPRIIELSFSSGAHLQRK